jgi:hypothetical protein
MSEIHDHSRVDAFLAARRKAMVLHALWRPMLAGALGAGMIIAAVAIAQPRFAFREIEVPKIVYRDATVPNIVAKDVEVPRIVAKDVEIGVPRIVATTPAERKFIDDPQGFANAPTRGKIVPSRSDRALSFDEGQDYFLTDASMSADATPYVGEYGFCSHPPKGIGAASSATRERPFLFHRDQPSKDDQHESHRSLLRHSRADRRL